MIGEVTDRDFDRVVEQSPLPVLVEFWKPGCGQCRALLRELESIERERGGEFLVVKMNVEENFQIPAELDIHSLPALAFYRRGRFDRFIGGIGTKEEILKQVLSAEPLVDNS